MNILTLLLFAMVATTATVAQMGFGDMGSFLVLQSLFGGGGYTAPSIGGHRGSSMAGVANTAGYRGSRARGSPFSNGYMQYGAITGNFGDQVRDLTMCSYMAGNPLLYNSCMIRAMGLN